MTTQVVKLPPKMAIRLALAADSLGMTHEEVLKEALRLYLDVLRNNK